MNEDKKHGQKSLAKIKLRGNLTVKKAGEKKGESK